IPFPYLPCTAPSAPHARNGCCHIILFFEYRQIYIYLFKDDRRREKGEERAGRGSEGERARKRRSPRQPQQASEKGPRPPHPSRRTVRVATRSTSAGECDANTTPMPRSAASSMRKRQMRAWVM